MLYYLIVVFFIFADLILYYKARNLIATAREQRKQKRNIKNMEKERKKLQKERAKRLAHEAMIKDVLDEAYPEKGEENENV